jgi:hypothetical protein
MTPIAQQMPEIEALFAAIRAFMEAGGWSNLNAYGQQGGGASTCGISVTDPNGNSYNYSETKAGPKVSITPPGATLAPGATQQFTAAVVDGNGAAVPGAVVVWTVSGTGSIDQTGLYTAPAAAGTHDTVTAKYQGSTASVTAQIV